MLRVGVFGAAGRMGQEVCRAVVADPDLELVAMVDPLSATMEASRPDGASGGAIVGEKPEILLQAGAEVAVDFTVAHAAVENLRWCASHGIHAVVGTSGMSDQDLAELGVLFRSSQANAVVVPNFAIGAVLMERFAELASSFMEKAEVIELHHDRKVDAPSGTALATAAAMARARERAGMAPFASDRTEREVIPGSRGAEGPGGTRLHAIRLPGLVAHQEVIFGAQGQSLTIRHDAYDRTAFMPGVVMAIKAVSSVPGLTIGLGSLLGL
jgi:4-hydroxy-tetrahydrodipicolinate reductase